MTNSTGTCSQPKQPKSPACLLLLLGWYRAAFSKHQLQKASSEEKKTMYIVLQHRGDQAKHFCLGFTLQGVAVKVFAPLRAKGDALWGLLVYTNTWPNPTQEHWTKPLHLGWVSSFVLHNEITSKKKWERLFTYVRSWKRDPLVLKGPRWLC